MPTGPASIERLKTLGACERKLLNRLAARRCLAGACDFDEQRLRDEREQILVFPVVAAQGLVVRRGFFKVPKRRALLKLCAQRAAARGGEQERNQAKRSHAHQPQPPLR